MTTLRHNPDLNPNLPWTVDHRPSIAGADAPCCLNVMNLQLSQFRTFTHRFAQRLKQHCSDQLQRASRASRVITESDVGIDSKRPLGSPLRATSSVQIALMQRMGVTGRPLMEACKSRSISI